MPEHDELWQKAQKQVEDKVGFYVHFAAYVSVNALFVAFWAMGNMGFPWFIIPMAGWGIGVAIHFVAVFMGQGYIERQTRREYDRMRGLNP